MATETVQNKENFVCPESTIESAVQRNAPPKKVAPSLSNSNDKSTSKGGSKLVCESTIDSANRRGFLKKAALFGAAAAVGTTLLGSKIIPESSASSCTKGSSAHPDSNVFYCCPCGVAIEGRTSSGIGVYGVACKSGIGVSGESCCSYGVEGCSLNGVGVYGKSFCNYGVEGYSPKNVGVYGQSSSSVGVWGGSCKSVGVYGKSTCNYGVEGYSPKNVGVYGKSCSSYGVEGSSSKSVGIYGYSPKSVGVSGESCCSYGVEGCSTKSVGVYGITKKGIGIQGIASGTCVLNTGVVGITDSPISGSSGVTGQASGGGSSLTTGIYGLSNSTSGQGVSGRASATSGANVGVIGSSCSTSGVGVLGVAGTDCTVPLASRAHSSTQKGNLLQFEKACGAELGTVVNNVGWLGIGTTTPATPLQVNGGVSAKVATVTANYSMSATDFGILANAASAGFSVTLPAAKTAPGMLVFIKKVDTSTNKVTVAAAGSDKIEGKSSDSLSETYKSLTLISDGSANWYILSNAT